MEDDDIFLIEEIVYELSCHIDLNEKSIRCPHCDKGITLKFEKNLC